MSPTFCRVISLSSVGVAPRLAVKLVGSSKALLLQPGVGGEHDQHLRRGGDDLLVVQETAVLLDDVTVRVLAVVNSDQVRSPETAVRAYRHSNEERGVHGVKSRPELAMSFTNSSRFEIIFNKSCNISISK